MKREISQIVKGKEQRFQSLCRLLQCTEAGNTTPWLDKQCIGHVHCPQWTAYYMMVMCKHKKHLNRVPDILRMHQQETWVQEVLHVR